ncbi:hypothetical protein MKW94_024577, partial [Papaver nudicaule]|nr:hypothetical protein [Papaver nudicaule]
TLYCEDMFTHMPTFRELRRLVVSSKLSLIMSMGLLHLLLTLPNVESVVIAQGFFPIKNYSGLDRYGLPECLLPRLTVVEIGEIDGKQEDLDIINCFLKISPGLQTMRIAFPSSLSQYRRDRVMEKILMLSKGSTCCEFNFLA